MNLYIKQWYEKFKNWNYTLWKKDEYWQRINIEIVIDGIWDKVWQKSFLKSWWLINEDNSISLNTPFSWFTK